MKRVLALLLVLVLCIGAFAACGEEEEPHVHTFGETWTTDAEGHWYAATCECEEVEITKLAHADKNNDGACDICEYKTACADGHSYDEGWTVDCTNHWHAADCGHLVAGSGVAAHADANNDGKCDTCFYVINDIHNHYYDDEWSSDADYHWHAALCEHSVEVADKAAHNVNAAGFCTVCEAKVSNVDLTNIEAVLNASMANTNKVVSGNVVFGEYEYSGSGDSMYLEGSSEEVIYFVLGNGSAYHFWKTFEEGNFFGADENWYELVGEDEVFGVSKVFGDYQLVPVTGTVNHLDGYTYHPGSILPSVNADTSTLADTIAALYAIKLDGTRVANATENYADGVYTFAFTYHIAELKEGTETHYNVEAFDVEVSFTVDEYYVIDQCDFKVEVYHNIEGLDNDLVYDSVNDTYTLNADANPSVFSYSVSQISGERNFINPFPKESLIPKSFDVYSADVEMREDEDGVAYYHVNYGAPIVDSITVNENSPLYIAFKNPVPATGSFAFIDFADLEITAVNKTDGETGVLFESNDFNPNYSKANGYLYIFVKDAGTYTLTIKYLDVVKSFDVVVEEAQQAPTEPVEENEIAVETTDTYVYDDEYTFVAAKGEGKYTFILPAFLGIQSKASKDANADPEYDVLGVSEGNDNYGQAVSVVFELEANEEFVFYVGAATKASWIISYEYEACEVDGGSQGGSTGTETPLIIGNNEISAADVTFAYTAATEGTLTLNIGNMIMGLVEMSYTINGENSTVLELGSSVELNLTAGDKVVITVIAEGYSTISASWSGSGLAPENPTSLAGTYTATLGGADVSFTVVITDTTITFTPPRSPEIVYTYEYDGTTVTLYLDGDLVTNPLSGALTAEGSVATTLSYNGNTFDLTSDEGGEVEEEGNGTDGAPYVWTELPESVTINSDTINKIYYLYTATASGNITFTWPTNDDSWGDWFLMDGEYTTATTGSSSETATMVVPVVAGETYRIGLGTFYVAGEFTITVAFAEGEGSEGGEEIVVDRYLYDGFENEIDVTDDDIAAGKFYLYFMPNNDGEYNFVSGDLFVSAVTLGGESVLMNENDKYVLESYVQYVLEVNANFVFEAGVYNLLANYSYPEGHQNNPFYVQPDCENGGFMETTATYQPYSSVWYSFYVVNNGTVTVTSDSDTATILITAVFGNEVEGTGSVSLDVIGGRYYYVGFADYTATEPCDIVFNVTVEDGEIETDGSANLPNFIVLGENTVSVEFYGITYLVYSATANGTLTLTVDDANCGWKAAKDFSELTSIMYAEAPIVIEVNEGDLVYVSVESIDGAASDFDFTADFSEAPTEAWFEGTLNLDGTANQFVIEDNTYLGFQINGATGNFVIAWDNADAIVKLYGSAIENGAVVSVANPYYGPYVEILFDGYAAGSVNVTITPSAPTIHELVIGDNTVSVTDISNGVQADFVAPEDGTYKFTVGANGFVVYDYSNYFADEVITIDLLAGETASFIVLSENYSEDDIAIAVAKAEAGAAPETVEGEYRYVDPLTFSHRWQLVFDANGTGTLKEQNFENLDWTNAVTSTFTYVYADGVVTIDFENGAQAADGSYTVSADGIAAVVLNGSPVDFEFFE